MAFIVSQIIYGSPRSVDSFGSVSVSANSIRVYIYLFEPGPVYDGLAPPCG